MVRHYEGRESTEGCAERLYSKVGVPACFYVRLQPGICVASVRRGFQDVGLSGQVWELLPPQTNGMVELLTHTLCPMLSYLIADRQKNRHYVYAIAAHNNTVGRGTGLAPNEAHTLRSEVTEH